MTDTIRTIFKIFELMISGDEIFLAQKFFPVFLPAEVGLAAVIIFLAASKTASSRISCSYNMFIMSSYLSVSQWSLYFCLADFFGHGNS